MITSSCGICLSYVLSQYYVWFADVAANRFAILLSYQLCHWCLVPHQPPPIWMVTLMIFSEDNISQSYSLCSFFSLLPSVVSSLSDPNIILSILSANIFSLYSYLIRRDKFHVHMSHQAKLHSCILQYSCFCIENVKIKKFLDQWYQAFARFHGPLISSWKQFWFFTVLYNCLDRTSFSEDLLSIFLLSVGETQIYSSFS